MNTLRLNKMETLHVEGQINKVKVGRCFLNGSKDPDTISLECDWVSEKPLTKKQRARLFRRLEEMLYQITI